MNEISKDLAIRYNNTLDSDLLIENSYDFMEEGINFRIKLKNLRKNDIKNINILIIPNQDIDIDERFKFIELMKPDEELNVSFIFIPQVHGIAKLYSIISYIDNNDFLQIHQMNPIEIQIQCPLFAFDRASPDEIFKHRKLLKRVMKDIDMQEIPADDIFKTIIENIKALELPEIECDLKAHVATYSGISKITQNKLIIRVKIVQNAINLRIYMTDIQKAIGLMAYLSNIISTSISLNKNLQGNIEKISNKIMKLSVLSKRFCDLFELCEINWNLIDILDLLDELIKNIEQNLPYLGILPLLKGTYRNLKFSRNKKYKINNNRAIDLEYVILNCLDELNKAIKNDLEIFKEAFSANQEQYSILTNLNQQMHCQKDIKEEIYSRKILILLVITEKLSGLSIFEHFFSNYILQANLVSGLLHAIKDFSEEVSRKKSKVNKLSFRFFEIDMYEGSKDCVISIVSRGKTTEKMALRLKKYLGYFEKTFKDELKKRNKNLKLFEEASHNIDDIFFS